MWNWETYFLQNTKSFGEANHIIVNARIYCHLLSSGRLRKEPFGSEEARFWRWLCLVILNSVFSWMVQKVLKDTVIIAEWWLRAFKAIQTVQFHYKRSQYVCSVVLQLRTCPYSVAASFLTLKNTKTKCNSSRTWWWIKTGRCKIRNESGWDPGVPGCVCVCRHQQ